MENNCECKDCVSDGGYIICRNCGKEEKISGITVTDAYNEKHRYGSTTQPGGKINPYNTSSKNPIVGWLMEERSVNGLDASAKRVCRILFGEEPNIIVTSDIHTSHLEFLNENGKQQQRGYKRYVSLATGLKNVLNKNGIPFEINDFNKACLQVFGANVNKGRNSLKSFIENTDIIIDILLNAGMKVYTGERGLDARTRKTTSIYRASMVVYEQIGGEAFNRDQCMLDTTCVSVAMTWVLSRLKTGENHDVRWSPEKEGAPFYSDSEIQALLTSKSKRGGESGRKWLVTPSTLDKHYVKMNSLINTEKGEITFETFLEHVFAGNDFIVERRLVKKEPVFVYPKKSLMYTVNGQYNN